MKIQFENDLHPSNTPGRTKRRFRITVKADFIIEDDALFDVQHIISGYDEDGDAEWEPRDMNQDPVSVKEISEYLKDNYESTAEFLADYDFQKNLNMDIVQVNEDGDAIYPDQELEAAE